MFSSYRSRLIALIATVIALMALVMLTSYSGARWAIQEDISSALRRSVQLYQHLLDTQRIELARVAAAVRDDPAVADYVFAAARIGAGTESLEKLLRRRFSRLSLDALVLFWPGGRVAVGTEAAELAGEIADWPLQASNNTFYVERPGGIFLVAVVPLEYQGEAIAQVAAAVDLGRRWLMRQALDPQTRLLFERDGRIFAASDPALAASDLDVARKRLRVGKEIFRLEQVILPAGHNLSTRLWLAQSDAATLRMLERFNQIMLWLALMVFAILVPAALMAVKSFTGPLQKLIGLTVQMAEGQLPELRRSSGRTEIDRLLNHFIDLIDALRQKQQEVDEVHKALLKASITDELTGLYNRRHLGEVFPKMQAQAQREQLCLAVILLDIDHFKKINDTYGHHVGDRCLQTFADILRRSIRASDYAFRMGGEEFMILALGHCDQDAELLAEKVRLAVERSIVTEGGKRVKMTVSAGVAMFSPSRPGKMGLSEVINCADRALYEVKHSGRNGVQVYRCGGVCEPVE
ncbi:MAG TPA: sensor domain-containing diguanylate cyclase [Gammaproteobacteria bacterium]|nr:sensor domain-containing diguanylate cyclase [Gammaproteobacteria bacterium]